MKTILTISLLFLSGFCASQAHNDTYEKGVEYNLDAYYTEQCTERSNTLMVDPIFTSYGMVGADSVLWLYTAEYSSNEYGYCTDTILTTDSYYTFELPFSPHSKDSRGSVTVKAFRSTVKAFRSSEYLGGGRWTMPRCKTAKVYADAR